MTKVLLVEDDNNLREIYQARLQSEGYEVITGKDGEDALSLIKQHQPELIITDVMMPRISGFEMLDILRNTPGIPQPRVIMLTALGQAEDRAHADGIGADLYLVKSQVTLEDIVKAAGQLTSEPAAPAVTAPEPAQVLPPEPTNIQIPEPTFVATQPPADQPAPVIPEPSSEAPVIATNQPRPIALIVDSPQPIVFPEPTVAAVPQPQSNFSPLKTEHEDLMNAAAENLLTNTPNQADPDSPDVIGENATGGNKVIHPLQSQSEERHISELIAEQEANNIVDGETQPFQASPTVVATGEEIEQLMEVPPILKQAIISPDPAIVTEPTVPPVVIDPLASAQPTPPPTNNLTPFTPNVGGDTNVNAL